MLGLQQKAAGSTRQRPVANAPAPVSCVLRCRDTSRHRTQSVGREDVSERGVGRIVDETRRPARPRAALSTSDSSRARPSNQTRQSCASAATQSGGPPPGSNEVAPIDLGVDEAGRHRGDRSIQRESSCQPPPCGIRGGALGAPRRRFRAARVGQPSRRLRASDQRMFDGDVSQVVRCSPAGPEILWAQVPERGGRGCLSHPTASWTAFANAARILSRST